MSEHRGASGKHQAMFWAVRQHAMLNPGSRIVVMTYNTRDLVARQFIRFCEEVPLHITVQSVILHPEYLIVFSNRAEVQFFNVEEDEKDADDATV